MKCRRRSAFVICTNAPGSGLPEASVMTPVRVPTAFCADPASGQNTDASNANAVRCDFSLADVMSFLP
jgi:hypothetical protein